MNSRAGVTMRNKGHTKSSFARFAIGLVFVFGLCPFAARAEFEDINWGAPEKTVTMRFPKGQFIPRNDGTNITVYRAGLDIATHPAVAEFAFEDGMLISVHATIHDSRQNQCAPKQCAPLARERAVQVAADVRIDLTNKYGAPRQSPPYLDTVERYTWARSLGSPENKKANRRTLRGYIALTVDAASEGLARVEVVYHDSNR